MEPAFAISGGAADDVMEKLFYMWRYPRMVSWFVVTTVSFLLLRLLFAKTPMIEFYIPFQPGIVLVPLAGVFWGPAGVLGVFVASLLGDWLLGMGSALSFFRGIGLFLFAYSAKHLWDYSRSSLDAARELSPRWRQTVRFLFVSWPGCFLAASWVALGTETLRLYPFPYILSLVLINNVVFTSLLGPALYRLMARELVPFFGSWRDVMKAHAAPPLTATAVVMHLAGCFGSCLIGFLIGVTVYDAWPTRAVVTGAFALGSTSGPLLVLAVLPFMVLQVVGLYWPRQANGVKAHALRPVVLLLALAVPVAGRAENGAGHDPLLEEAEEEVYWNLPSDFPDAQKLLAEVRAALPREPLRVEAQLQAKDASGDIEQTLSAEMLLRWNATASRAVFTIRDAFGSDPVQLTVTHSPGAFAQYEFLAGDPLQPASPPDVYSVIPGTDVTWVDLSLGFLWWPGGETTGVDKLKGRYCYVVDMLPPVDHWDGAGYVRLWIDPKVDVLLQAAAYNQAGEMIRRLQVKSLQKIDDLWVVKDLEVRSYPSEHRTVLRVRSVEPVPPPEPG